MSPVGVANDRPPYLLAAEDLRGNPGQWQAYQSKGNCVILAGPGSGKTKTLTVKLARMLSEDVRSPRGIACITYSNECVRELRRRLKLLGIDDRKNVFIGTVHSFCLRNVLAPYARLTCLDLPFPLTVARRSEHEALFAKALAREVSADVKPSDWRPRADSYRRTYLDRDIAEWRGEDEELARLVEHYERLLRQKGLIDFDDMTLAGTRLIAEHEWVRRALRARFPILVVDEYQDLGVPLDRIVRCLCLDAGIRLLAVGDPDQSIYGFNGAKPELLRELSQVLGIESVRLRFNYRCGRSIVRASEVALGEPRGYESRGKHEGLIDWHHCRDGLPAQAAFICGTLIPAILQRNKFNLGDVAVLYRTKYDGDVIAEAAANNNYKVSRNDGNGAIPRTPLIRWLEECAAWCAGGWRHGVPPLSWLVRQWLNMNPALGGGTELQEGRRALVGGLLLGRTPGALLRDWLEGMRAAVLEAAFAREPTLRQEAEDYTGFAKAVSRDGKLKHVTLEAFAGQTGAPDHLNLITLHSSKGLEFEAVIVMGMDQGNIPPAARGRGTAESRRLFYVGLTRAKREFHMTYSGWVQRYGRRQEWGPSDYLTEAQQLLEERNDAAT